MTAISTITEISTEDMPYNVLSGTGRRRLKVMIRATSGGAGDTLDLSTTIADISGIEGFSLESIAAADAATRVTWSGNIITFAGHTSTGVTILEGTIFLT